MSEHWRLVEIDGKTTVVFTADAIDENNYTDGTNAWIGGDEHGPDDMRYVQDTTAHLAVLRLAYSRGIEAVEIVPPGMLTSQEKALAAAAIGTDPTKELMRSFEKLARGEE